MGEVVSLLVGDFFVDTLIMKAKKHLYIVSFGNSEKYRYVYDAPAYEGISDKPSPFGKIEKQLTDYLESKFPMEPVAYYTSAKAVEVYPEHVDKFASYPVLDEKAIAEIEKVLEKEVREQMANKDINRDAPWSNV